jgi:uncharacterized protein with NAD-binding domain and iron-sulfur cluster
MKRKIAILGGGISSLSAAFEISSVPNWHESYDITVYQLGWRLGGKGASSRNEELKNRIEEHGLHIWLGFYENAFSLIRECYSELRRPPEAPLGTWDAAFKRHSFVVLEEQMNGQWSHLPCSFPTNDSLPGDGSTLPTLWDYVLMAIEWIEQTISSMATLRDPQVRSVQVGGKPPWWGKVKSQLVADVDLAALSSGLALIRMAREQGRRLDKDPAKHSAIDHQIIHWFMQRLTTWMHSVVHLISDQEELLKMWIPIDLFTSVVSGVLADGVIYNGLDSIDGYDLRQWLRKHGASDLSLASAWIRAGYDLTFSFVDGDSNRPNVAAGVAIRALFRMVFTYKGAVIWKMQAGMGETVFTPLYQVLKARGVKFKFFHKVVNLALSADRKSVSEIEIALQATVIPGEYDPLVSINGLPCWPVRPKFEQLQESAELRVGDHNLESFWTAWKDVGTVRLQAGMDFDTIVLGISIASLQYLCKDLIAANGRLAEMVTKVKTIQTQGFQIWVNRSLAECGWPYESPILGAYVEPMDTWADMSHLLKMECWPPDNVPSQLAYFCGVMPDAQIIPGPEAHDFPSREYKRTQEFALNYLESKITYLWPRSLDAGNGSFDWNLLAAPKQSTGMDRFRFQYWRPNIDPSERYVLAVAGSTEFRLRTDESGFANLILTGDWIRNGFNSPGCIESAVISGRQAARAITGGAYNVIGETDFT